MKNSLVILDSEGSHSENEKRNCWIHCMVHAHDVWREGIGPPPANLHSNMRLTIGSQLACHGHWLFKLSSQLVVSISNISVASIFASFNLATNATLWLLFEQAKRRSATNPVEASSYTILRIHKNSQSRELDQPKTNAVLLTLAHWTGKAKHVSLRTEVEWILAPAPK